VPFYGANRPGAQVSQGLRDSSGYGACRSASRGLRLHKAFSEIDPTSGEVRVQNSPLTARCYPGPQAEFRKQAIVLPGDLLLQESCRACSEALTWHSCPAGLIVKQFRANHYLAVPPYATIRRSSAKRLAITDKASPFALRSTRNRLRTAVHRRCQSQVVEGCRDDGAGVRARDDHAGVPARDLPETALHVTSRRLKNRPSTALLTSVVVWAREVLRRVVNSPSINGKDGVAGSIPAGGSTPNQQPRPGPTPGLFHAQGRDVRPACHLRAIAALMCPR
jgi:hypothetical protein